MRPDSQHKSREKRFSVFRRPFGRFGKIARFHFRAIYDAVTAGNCRHATVVSRYSTPAFIKISAFLNGIWGQVNFESAKIRNHEYALFFKFLVALRESAQFSVFNSKKVVAYRRRENRFSDRANLTCSCRNHNKKNRRRSFDGTYTKHQKPFGALRHIIRKPLRRRGDTVRKSILL